MPKLKFLVLFYQYSPAMDFTNWETLETGSTTQGEPSAAAGAGPSIEGWRYLGLAWAWDHCVIRY